MRKPTLSNAEAGFGMLEVIVSILVLTIFLLIAGEGMVVSAAFRVQAERQRRADLLVEEDIEEIRANAAQIKFKDAVIDNTSKCSATTPSSGFALILIDKNKLPSLGNTKILNKNYNIVRTIDITGPIYNILELQYEVKEAGDSGKVILTTTTKVPINASLECLQES